MEIAKKILLKVYPFYLVVLVGKDHTKIRATLARMGISLTNEEWSEFIQSFTDKGFSAPLDFNIDDDGYERAVFLLWLRQTPKNNRWMTIVRHECQHITNMIFDHIGQQTIPFDDDEVETYANDYIFETVLDILNPKGRKK
jgi:hypothetical protein